MRSWVRNTALAGGTVALAAALFVVGAAVGAPTGEAPSAPAATAPAVEDPLARGIADLQKRLENQPANYRAWTELGNAYLQQARGSADPALYPKADGAFAQSLRLRPDENPDALVGQAALAAVRHDFADALRLVNRALTVNDYSATAYGVKVDALTELGRYDEARAAAQRMLDLRPGVDAFARASYQLELRGDVPGARAAMERAAQAANGADEAFARYYLGELAWNNGDAVAARTAYDAALLVDPEYLPALAGQAKAMAAAGDPTAALAVYRDVAERQPLPEYVVQLGELLEATGQAAAAREQYDVVRATQQLFAAAGANVDVELALFEADHGAPVKALEYARAAYQARPLSILTQDAYAWALHRAGRSAEALPIARQAQRLGTHLPSLRYHLGVIEAANGNRVQARRWLTSALALNPSFSPLQAPEARKLLKTLA